MNPGPWIGRYREMNTLSSTWQGDIIVIRKWPLSVQVTLNGAMIPVCVIHHSLKRVLDQYSEVFPINRSVNHTNLQQMTKTHISGGIISTSQHIALRLREPSPILVTMAWSSIQHSSSPPSNFAIDCSTCGQGVTGCYRVLQGVTELLTEYYLSGDLTV